MITIILINDLYPEFIKNMYKSIIESKHSYEKGANDLNRSFKREDIQTAYKNLKRHPTLLGIRKMQLKAK